MAESDTAVAAVSLPRDALLEILSRTPVKSLCRFRCVSKEWQALISDRSFVAHHKSRTLLEPLLVTSYNEINPYNHWAMLVMDMEGNVVRKMSLRWPWPGGLGVNFASSLDDLACIICSDNIPRLIVVATGKVLMDFGKPAGNIRKHVVRLGRAAVSGSCNAVRIVELRRSYGVQPPQTCEVLTVRGGHWRKAQPPPADVRLLDFAIDWSGATVNGVVHFLSSIKSPARDSVLRFDLESEEWRKTIQGPLKDDRELGITSIRITEFDRSLCMIHVPVHGTCNIWRLLTDPGDSVWVKAYSIPGIWSDEPVQPLRMTHDGVKLLFYSRRGKLCVYDPRSETCTTAMNMPVNAFHIIGLCSFHLERFVESPKTNARRR